MPLTDWSAAALSLLPLLALLGGLTAAAAEPTTPAEVFARVRAHDFHPVRDGFTFDRTLNQHGVADPADADWRVRTLAVRDLVRLGPAHAAELRAGLNDAHAHVRQLAAMALGILRQRDAVPGLVALLQGDAESFVRAQAAVALGQIGDAGALPAVEAAQQADAANDVQHQGELAAYALRHGKSATPELAAAYAGLDEARFDRARVGAPAPDFTLTDTEGRPWRLADFRGQREVVLIWVFADWCPVCHREFHELIELREEFARANLEVVTLEAHDTFPARVMVGRELEPAYWFSKQSFKEAYTGKIWWPHLVDRAAAVGVEYGIRPMAYAVHAEFINRPAVVIVDREGIVRFLYTGTFWGDRPSIHQILEMVRTRDFSFVHPKRLPAPAAPAG